MRHRAHILGALLLLSAAAMGFACSLNPQPFPPASANGAPDAGAFDDAFAPFADAGGGTDAGVANPDGGPGDAGIDAGSDAASDGGSDGATDGGDDGGDAVAPSDAALDEGG